MLGGQNPRRSVDLRAFGELRHVSFTGERGLTIADIGFYHDAMSHLLRREVVMLSSRLSSLPRRRPND